MSILPLNLQSTDFELFEIPAQFAQDRNAIDAKWKDLQRQAHGDIQADAQAQNGDPAGGVTGFPEESCHGIILLNFFQRRALRMFTVKPWGAFCKYTDCRISVDSIGNRRF